MQHVISDLVSRFERGRLSRRELIQALTAVAATGGGDGISRVAQSGQHQPHLGSRQRHGALNRFLQPRLRSLRGE